MGFINKLFNHLPRDIEQPSAATAAGLAVCQTLSEHTVQSTSPRSPGQAAAGGRAHRTPHSLRSHGAAASTTIRRDLATSRPCTDAMPPPPTSRARNTPEAPAQLLIKQPERSATPQTGTGRGSSEDCD